MGNYRLGMEMNEGYGTYLAHHGIKGQKWGVRRFQNPDGTYTSAGRQRYGIGDGETYSGVVYGSTKKKGNDTPQSPASSNFEAKKDKWGTAKFVGKLLFDVATLNPVGLAYDITDAGRAAAASVKAANVEKDIGNSEIDSKTGLHKKTREYSVEEDLKAVNPRVGDFNSDSKNNCGLCTATYEMRRRGFNVTANLDKVGTHDEQVSNWFKGAKFENIGDKSLRSKRFDFGGKQGKQYAESVIKDMKKYPEGSRGDIRVHWFGSGGGHSMFWEIQNGNFVIRDAQTNTTYTDPMKVLKLTSDVRVARLDNLDFDPAHVKEFCK